MLTLNFFSRSFLRIDNPCDSYYFGYVFSVLKPMNSSFTFIKESSSSIKLPLVYQEYFYFEKSINDKITKSSSNRSDWYKSWRVTLRIED